jgi:hypothetical protein
MYDREGIGSRVVAVYPEGSWASSPELSESDGIEYTEFELAWNTLLDKLNIWHYLHRADEISGIGRFGVMLIGFNDGLDYEQPVPGLDQNGIAIDKESFKNNPDKKLDVLYLRTFDERHVRIDEVIDDATSPRNGLPLYYQIIFNENDALGYIPSQHNDFGTYSQRVHWTRVLHLADNRGSSELFGVPRMQKVFNYLLTTRKVSGGSGEMYWGAASPGYAFETHPDLAGLAEIDAESIKSQLDDFYNNLQRYIALTGMSAKSLAPQNADPGPHLEQQLRLIAATIGCPLRVLLGAESGHLASTQDAVAWNKRLSRRQTQYLEPMVIKPFVRRLIEAGILPRPQNEIFNVAWKDLNDVSDTEKADVALKKAQAILQYVTSGAETVMPLEDFYVQILGFSVGEALTILKTLDSSSRKKYTETVWNQPPAMPAGSGPKTTAKKTNEQRNKQTGPKKKGESP